MAKQTFTTGQVLTAAQQNSLQSNDFNQTVSVKTANYSLLAADKGTRIEFNTSGSVTCTVNSGQFDAGDTLIIQNRGAGTATITAGTATVNTSASLALAQYSAGTLYFVSDSAALFFGDAAGISASLIDAKGDLIVGTADNTVGRLAVGTNGYTLVADSSVSPTGLKWAVDPVADVVTTAGDLLYATAADTVTRLGIGTAGQVLKVNSGATAPEWGAAGGGGWTLLYTVTMTGASNISQATDFTGYRDAVVEYENVTCGSTWNLETRINSSTTLLYAQTLSNNTTALVNVEGGSFTQTGSGGAQTSARLDGLLTINNPASTAAFKVCDYQSTYTRNAAGSPIWSLTTKGVFRSASAITSIVFESNSSNFTGGSVRIYGVK